jgi:hypothetical protein
MVMAMAVEYGGEMVLFGKWETVEGSTRKTDTLITSMPSLHEREWNVLSGENNVCCGYSDGFRV